MFNAIKKKNQFMFKKYGCVGCIMHVTHTLVYDITVMGLDIYKFILYFLCTKQKL